MHIDKQRNSYMLLPRRVYRQQQRPLLIGHVFRMLRQI
jgi:hypothetical protein